MQSFVRGLSLPRRPTVPYVSNWRGSARGRTDSKRSLEKSAQRGFGRGCLEGRNSDGKANGVVRVGGNLRSPPVPLLESVLLVRIVAHSPVSSESKLRLWQRSKRVLRGKLGAEKRASQAGGPGCGPCRGLVGLTTARSGCTERRLRTAGTTTTQKLCGIQIPARLSTSVSHGARGSAESFDELT